jgi:hypothetical protein
MTIPFGQYVATLLAGTAAAGLAMPAHAGPFVAGDLVVSVEGGNGAGDNQAAPLNLEDLHLSGGNPTGAAATVASTVVLPQTTTVVNGVTQYAVSGEYGSSSEGGLQLSGNGQYLTIAGYGVNAAAFNANPGNYGGVTGNTALAQSSSSLVPRVVAEIDANGNVDSSTALTNVFNENNPRSVYSPDGTTFYVSGQGAFKGDTATEGLFVATKGASTATQLIGANDTRSVTGYNGTLYVSQDYNPPSTPPAGSTTVATANVSSVTVAGGGLPTGANGPVSQTQVIPTTGAQIAKLTAAEENGVNNGRLGNNVYLSPEAYFFASPTVLYVADSGSPKNGNVEKAALGDGGLQKWVLVNGTWTLEYTLYKGLNLVDNSGTSGVTGLLGLTGEVVGNSVELFATSYTIGDLDQSYLFGITDTLNNLTDPTTESFTTLLAASAGTNIKGVSFAPEAAQFPVPEPAALAMFATGLGLLGLLRRVTAPKPPTTATSHR